MALTTRLFGWKTSERTPPLSPLGRIWSSTIRDSTWGREKCWDWAERLTEIVCSHVAVNNDIVITLRIDNIVEEDDAVYLCQVKVGINDMITKRVKLNVKTPVRIVDSSTTELTVVEGEVASLECLTSGYPAPVVEWSRTDGRVMFNTKTKAVGETLQ